MNNIEIGDLVQKFSVKLYENLYDLLNLMPAMTPELRAQKLNQHITSSKQKINTLLSLCKWLKTYQVKESLSRYANDLMVYNVKNFERDQILNGIYYFHAGLYPNRIQPLSIKMSKEIISRGNYPYLPESIFSDATDNQHKIDKENAIKNLNLYIKAKCALRDKIPDNCDKVELNAGVLILTKNNLFQVAFTLSHFDIDAHWKPLNFNLIFKSSNENIPAKSPQSKILELKTFDTLLKIYFSSINNSTSSNLSISLIDLWKICHHLSLMHVIRIFYIQAHMIVKSNSMTNSTNQTNFLEELEQTTLSYSFWKSNIPNLNRFELKISLSRSDLTQEVVQLFALFDLDPHQPKNQQQLLIKELPDGLNRSIETGNIIVLYQYAMEHCSHLLLSILYRSLIDCEELVNAIDKGLCVQLSESSVNLFIEDVAIHVLIDPRTGLYTLSSTLLGAMGVKLIQITDRFLHEINDISFEKRFWDKISEMQQSSDYEIEEANKYSMIKTLDDILISILLIYWSNRVEKSLGISSFHNINLPDDCTLIQNPESSVFFLLEDKDINESSNVIKIFLVLSISNFNNPPNFHVIKCQYDGTYLLKINSIELVDRFESEIDPSWSFRDQIEYFPSILQNVLQHI